MSLSDMKMTVSLIPLNTSGHGSVKAWMENQNIQTLLWPKQTPGKSKRKPVENHQAQKENQTLTSVCVM